MDYWTELHYLALAFLSWNSTHSATLCNEPASKRYRLVDIRRNTVHMYGIFITYLLVGPRLKRQCNRSLLAGLSYENGGCLSNRPEETRNHTVTQPVGPAKQPWRPKTSFHNAVFELPETCRSTTPSTNIECSWAQCNEGEERRKEDCVKGH